MKRTTYLAGLLALTALFLTSCAPRLTGNWTVKRFETLTPGQPGASLLNIGNILFNTNGTGEKTVNYTLLGADYNDEKPFKWKSYNGEYMTIESEGSEFSKTWIVVANKKKQQLWKSTDGANKVQIIELERQP